MKPKNIIPKREVNSFWRAVREKAIETLDKAIAAMRKACDEKGLHEVAMNDGEEMEAGAVLGHAAEHFTPTIIDLKATLMMLGNNLVTEHHFEPGQQPNETIGRGVTAQLYDSAQKRTSIITLLTDFINTHPEAREELRKMGFQWAMPGEGYAPPIQRPGGIKRNDVEETAWEAEHIGG